MSYAALFFFPWQQPVAAPQTTALRAAGDYTTGAARDISQRHAASYIACAVSGAAQAG
jgi:hypothetical protein